LISWLPTETT
jgi:hypothetical protein